MEGLLSSGFQVRTRNIYFYVASVIALSLHDALQEKHHNSVILLPSTCLLEFGLTHEGLIVYHILIFRTLRKLFKVDPADYMISICGNDALRELSSPGKSGSFFYMTNDDRYMIKTMKKAEVKVSSFSASCI